MLPMHRPYEDELLASAVVRGCRFFGVTFKQLAQLMMGKHALTGSFLSFGPLSSYEQFFRLPAKELLARHTVVPYGTAFSSLDVQGRTVQAALSSDPARYGVASIISHAAGAPTVRRYCDMCIDEDEARHGESFWHLSHQLPGCFVCWKHGVVLKATDKSLLDRIGVYKMPHEAQGIPCTKGKVPAAWHEVAKESARLASRGLTEPENREGDFYRRLAVQQGWLADAGQAVSSQRVFDALSQRFDKSWLADADLYSGERVRPWWGLMFQSVPLTPFSTVKHVVMNNLLQGPAQPLRHKPVGYKGRDHSALDAEYRETVKTVIARREAAGEKCRKRDLLEEAGCWHIYRHDNGPQSLPAVHRVISKFQRSELGHRPLALEQFLVPGRIGTATRGELVRDGHLVGAREAAIRIGRPWTDMKSLAKDHRILSVRYVARDWYPAFWCALGPIYEELEALHQLVRHLPLVERWRFFANGCKFESQTDLAAALKGKRARKWLLKVQPQLQGYFEHESAEGGS